MGYRFERDATVQKDLRRIAIAQIDGAVASIDDHGLASGVVVHEVRKSCKKLRGLLRIVRPGFDGYARENGAFRDMAAALSPLRDAAVLIETYDALMDAQSTAWSNVRTVCAGSPPPSRCGQKTARPRHDRRRSQTRRRSRPVDRRPGAHRPMEAVRR